MPARVRPDVRVRVQGDCRRERAPRCGARQRRRHKALERVSPQGAQPTGIPAGAEGTSILARNGRGRCGERPHARNGRSRATRRAAAASAASRSAHTRPTVAAVSIRRVRRRHRRAGSRRHTRRHWQRESHRQQNTNGIHRPADPTHSNQRSGIAGDVTSQTRSTPRSGRTRRRTHGRSPPRHRPRPPPGARHWGSTPDSGRRHRPRR